MIINKITYGFVIQSFDTEKQAWTKQEFIAGDNCEYEADSQPVSSRVLCDAVTNPELVESEGDEPYLPFEMTQPKYPLTTN